MPDLAADLLTSARQRLDELNRLLEGLIGKLAASESATAEALGVFEYYGKAMTAQLDNDEALFDDLREDLAHHVRLRLRDIGIRLEEIEEWFMGGADASVPPMLVDAVTAECERFLLTERHVVLAVGNPDNMATLVVELADLVLSDFVADLEIAANPPTDRFALIQISRLEASNPIWRPLIVGHEVAHLGLLDFWARDSFEMGPYLDYNVIGQLHSLPTHHKNPQSQRDTIMKATAYEWVEEIICDAYTVRRWGPAAVAALGSYLEQFGGIEEYGSHPPGWLRIRLMLDQLGEIDEALRPIIEPWIQLGRHNFHPADDWAEFLVTVISEIAPEVPAIVSQWTDVYDCNGARDIIVFVADSLSNGIPLVHSKRRLASDEDIVSAAWLARSRPHPKGLYDLVAKALELADFLRRWQQAGGTVEDMTTPIAKTDGPSGMLTADAIRRRTEATGRSKLVISPLLPKAIDKAGVDIRLGRHFIVFQRSSTGTFDALQRTDDPRTMQRALERRWGEQFVLHPGEVVLATTLEFIVLPEDTGAQVVTRSSYGRLGLITATAIQVHPLYRGCLTLELVNLGALPLSLYPGQRIAQLTFYDAMPPLDPKRSDATYDGPTRPEFSKVRADWDAQILRDLTGSHPKDAGIVRPQD